MDWVAPFDPGGFDEALPLEWSGTRNGGLRLAAGGVPDGAWGAEVQAFSPDGLGATLVVNADAEVVSEGKAEAAQANVGIAGRVARHLRFCGPGCAAVGGTAVKRVPERMISSVHPCDPHIARVSRCQGRKGVLHG